jgi:PKD repeat protein
MMRSFGLFAIVFVFMAGVGCHKNEPIPVANFSITSSNDSSVPDTVTFHNLSQNSPTCEWDFGDKQTSTETNPVHIYTVPGTYDIILKAYSESRQQWAFKDQKIKLK